MNNWIQNNRQQIFKVLGSLMALGSLFFLLEQQSWGDILDAVKQVSWQRFLLVFGLIMISRFFVVGRWYILLRSSGIEMGFGQSARITFTGLFASNFLPSTVGGDLVRIGGTIQLGHDRAISTASVLVDRLVGMLGMTMLAPLGLLSLFQWYSTHPELGRSAISIPAVFQKILNAFKKFIKALQIWIKKPLSLFGSLLLTWGHMLCLFTALQIMSIGLGEYIPFWELAGIWSLAYFITLIPISVNGYGLQELSIAYLLSNIGGFSLASSLAIALLIRIVFIIASLPGAFFLSSILASIRSDKELYEEAI